MFANNELGSINNVAEIAKIANAEGIILHVDAVQCIGKLPINLNDLGIDLMSISAHKFYGPKGIGALFIRKGINLNPILDGGGQELNLRPGTENIAGIAGLGLAIKKTCDNIEKSIEYIKKLETRFIEQLNKYNLNYILHIEERLPGVLAIGFPGIDGQSLLIALDLKGIAISFGSACSSGRTKASKILLDAGIKENLAKSTLRISFGKIHSNDDIDYVAKELSSIINRINK
jgi:cysteine desulfurase